MKKSIDLRFIIILLAAVLYTLSSTAQNFKKLDDVPHDIAYYRVSKLTKPLVKVIYGRPTHNKKTEIFGTKVPFNELWRTGANKATEVKLYNDVIFGNKLVNAGTYVIYTIPNKEYWDVILSSNIDVLGAHQYDSIFDIARIRVQVSRVEERVHTFSIGFEKQSQNNASMLIAWGTARVKVPLEFKEQTYYARNNKKPINNI